MRWWLFGLRKERHVSWARESLFASQEWHTEWCFFNTVLSVGNSDVKCNDLHRLRQHCLETGNETSCFQVLRPTCKQSSRVCVCVCVWCKCVGTSSAGWGLTRSGDTPAAAPPRSMYARCLPALPSFEATLAYWVLDFRSLLRKILFQTIPCITNVVSRNRRPSLTFCNVACQLMCSVSERKPFVNPRINFVLQLFLGAFSTHRGFF